MAPPRLTAAVPLGPRQGRGQGQARGRGRGRSGPPRPQLPPRPEQTCGRRTAESALKQQEPPSSCACAQGKRALRAQHQAWVLRCCAWQLLQSAPSRAPSLCHASQQTSLSAAAMAPRPRPRRPRPHQQPAPPAPCPCPYQDAVLPLLPLLPRWPRQHHHLPAAEAPLPLLYMAQQRVHVHAVVPPRGAHARGARAWPARMLVPEELWAWRGRRPGPQELWVPRWVRQWQREWQRQ